MFPCRSCMRRHLYTLLGDPISYQFKQRVLISPKCASRATVRSFSATSQTWDRLKKPVERRGQQNKTQPGSKKPGKVLRPANIRKELTYLGDPLKLATHIYKLLRQDKFDEAELIVETASKTFPCTVSWNHLIDWQLSRGKVNGAMKSYNEMKKRGQKPDAHTYTILFRGLAEFSHYPQALSKALSIYHSMDAVNSPVTPNVIHTNAVLKVCARAKDMDALYGIVAKLRRKGIRAPNNLTYTTILNAIQRQAVEVAAAKSVAERGEIYQKAIMEARKLWIEVIEQWRQGDMFIDEELTCSMGRILLLGEREDVDDVFSLIEQTMNIPRLVPRSVVDADNQRDSTVDMKERTVNGGTESSVVKDSMEDLPPHDEFRVVTRPKEVMRRSDAYVKPGRNSLSLVLGALKDARMRRPLEEYWDAFTKTRGVIPDSNNFHTYLQNLRVRRASSDAVDLLLKMPQEMLQMKTFRIAMSTCARDKMNQNSFTNASKILDLMEKTLSVLDVPSLLKYMEVALYGGGNPGVVPTRAGTNETAHARGRQVLRALERLNPCILNVSSALAYDERPDTAHVSKSAPVTDRASAIILVREMISAYDKLLSNSSVAQDRDGHLKRERSKLAAFVTRYNAGPRKMISAGKDTEEHNSQSEQVAPGDKPILRIKRTHLSKGLNLMTV